ncbi:MAG TPA: site-specific integrase, partial [Vicinamibacterales bacterium]
MKNKGFIPPEGREAIVNDPRSALFDQFVQERRYLKNVTPRTLRWYQEAFRAYRATLPPDSGPVPTKATLQHFVINWQERGLKATSCNSRIIALNAFCAWLHQEGHLPDLLKLKKLRVE